MELGTKAGDTGLADRRLACAEAINWRSSRSLVLTLLRRPTASATASVRTVAAPQSRRSARPRNL